MSKDSLPQSSNDEVDLGQLFNAIGRLFERFFSFIGGLLNKLFLAFVWLVFFVNKHFIKLVIAAVIGYAYGYIRKAFSEEMFKSSITIKQNYSIGENLYNTLDYYNSLVSQADYATLGQVLELDSSRVSAIRKFEINPLVSDNEKLLEFNDYLKNLDTTIAANLEYNQYIKNVNDYIYKYQQITILSRATGNFDKVFDGIINSVRTNEYYLSEQKKDLEELENREDALKALLVQSDSLQSTYKKVLERSVEQKEGSQTSITIEGGEETAKTKEFDLYLNDIELRNELVAIERAKANKKHIIEVISSTGNKGFVDSSIKVFNMSFSPSIFYAIMFALITFFIMLALRFVAYLEKYKTQV